MTKLPSKELLDGSKIPKTTTGEMKDALGKLYDYLDDLLGEDSADKGATLKKLGLDLTDWANRLDTKADKTEVENRVKTLEEKIAERGVPVGSIDWFAMTAPPAGYLKCDGSVVGRETYPDLFAAIGTTFGEGDGEATFMLPDLIGRFAEGSAIPGTVREAGLPELEGHSNIAAYWHNQVTVGGVFRDSNTWGENTFNIAVASGTHSSKVIDFKASNSNPIYGSSSTVQPPALTLLPCIKAFDAVVDPGRVDMTALANEVSGITREMAEKAEKDLSNLDIAGKVRAANFAMPSTSAVALTLPASGGTFVAPADGWVVFVKVAAAVGEYLEISGDYVASSCMAAAYGMWCKVFLPVQKNGNFTVYYNTTGETKMFHFVYANGSQP